MDPLTFVLLSSVLTYGVPIAWAVRELILLRRDKGSRRPDGDAVPERGGPLPSAPEDEPPLPDSFFPWPLTRRPVEDGPAPAPRPKVLEPA